MMIQTTFPFYELLVAEQVTNNETTEIAMTLIVEVAKDDENQLELFEEVA